MRKDLRGKKFGRVSVLEYVCFSKTSHGSIWSCVCDCGKKFDVLGASLVSGNTKSCGCYHSDVTIKKFTIHGETNKTTEWRSWNGAKNRCLNPNNPKYKKYGGRGIKICDRWRHSFNNFLLDMGRKPSPQHSLGRINNDLGYSPENCRWETMVQQQNNRSSNRVISWKGISKTVCEWARHLKVPGHLLDNRLRRGWSIQRTLTV